MASGEYGDVVSRLVSGIENGSRIYQENESVSSASPALSHGNTKKFIVYIFRNMRRKW